MPRDWYRSVKLADFPAIPRGPRSQIYFCKCKAAQRRRRRGWCGRRYLARGYFNVKREICRLVLRTSDVRRGEPRGWIIGRPSIRLLSIWISIRRNWCLPSGVANAAVNVKSASPTLTDRCCENASVPIDELPANCLLEKFRCRSEHRDIEPLLVSALRLRRTAMQSVLEIEE